MLNFETPVAEVVLFDIEDVVATSGIKETEDGWGDD